MSTPAVIAQRLSSGVYRCITVHWDGHPDTAGQTLVKFYSSDERVNDLFALGDLSELYPSLDACVAYHRDKGEDLESNAPGYFATLEDLESWREEFGGQYLYIWDGVAWQYRGVPLADVLVKAGVDAAPVPAEPDMKDLAERLATALDDCMTKLRAWHGLYAGQVGADDREVIENAEAALAAYEAVCSKKGGAK